MNNLLFFIWVVYETLRHCVGPSLFEIKQMLNENSNFGRVKYLCKKNLVFYNIGIYYGLTEKKPACI